MTSNRHRTHAGCKLVTACVLAALLTACNALGPAAISGGRLAYNEAIGKTNRQQMLMAVIHNRYGEQGSLLGVASITANVRVATSAGLQLGAGNSGNYAGNLVPFSAGAAYEENPTISYTPAAGEKYLRKVMSPLPVAVFARLAGTMTDPAPLYAALLSSINGIYNPDFRFTANKPDPRFMRVAVLMSKLTRMRRLHWVEDPSHAGRFSIVINHHAPEYTAEVDELLDLLGLTAPGDPAAPVTLSVSLALQRGDTRGIAITTRSVFQLVEILSAAVELPTTDRGNGIAQDYPPPGLVGERLHIHRSDARPEHSAVAVQYRDGWFYIADNDLATKQFFRMLSTLWSVTVAESTAKASAAPVLTVPVSR